MKIINKILGILILLSFYSCIKEYETTTYFYINNHSSYNIKLIVYNADVAFSGYTNDTTIHLPIGKDFSYFKLIKGENSPATFPFGAAADSVDVYINDSIVITYKQNLRFLDDNKNNILRIDSYVGGKEKKDLYRYYYTFLDENLSSYFNEN